MSKLQSPHECARGVVDSEAEYMALTEACKEAVWLQSLMREIGIDYNINPWIFFVIA